MANDPLTDAMDDIEEQQNKSEDTGATSAGADVDIEEFLSRVEADGRVMDETIGIAVSEEMNAIWRQLRKPSDEGGIDMDVTQSVRDHIEKLALRHEDASKRAIRKYEIDRE